jgi:hypothetical protein
LREGPDRDVDDAAGEWRELGEGAAGEVDGVAEAAAVADADADAARFVADGKPGAEWPIVSSEP